ncbi:hypothetical protein LS71_000295 [Helicobacter jaachi]|uniref:Nitrogen fixation protein FixH n=1 Tax=Helicobacter jaachi TaxID=1677920 RepID=A0A4U8TBD7_9HELI|nr:hypothetical protein [Helicobacter jaachi]TLD97240.1 hypothetical protein LS71_000295 [Helicobacter jaachi]
MKNKNYWPHAIIAILLFGVVMVSISITIALKNPIQDENTYFGKKRDVDWHINDIIKEQNHFNALYTIKPIILDKNANELAHNPFIFPYMAPAHTPDAPDSKSKPLPQDITLHIALQTNTDKAPPIFHLYLDSMHEANKLQDLGILKKEADNLYTSGALHLPQGRWKLVLKITYDNDKSAYFESEIFVENHDE